MPILREGCAFSDSNRITIPLRFMQAVGPCIKERIFCYGLNKDHCSGEHGVVGGYAGKDLWHSLCKCCIAGAQLTYSGYFRGSARIHLSLKSSRSCLLRNKCRKRRSLVPAGEDHQQKAETFTTKERLQRMRPSQQPQRT